MRQRRGAVRGIDGGFHEAIDIADAALRDAMLDAVQRAGDSLQQIVEIMGDAAGQLADRFHLLRLAKRLLRLQ